MKKILSILSVIGIAGSSVVMVVACGNVGTIDTYGWTQRNEGVSTGGDGFPVLINKTYYLSTIDYTGTDGQGLYTSTNGKTWAKDKNIPLKSDNHFFTPPKLIGKTIYLASSNDGLWTSTDGQKFTIDQGEPATNLWTAPIEINGTYYLATQGDGMLTSPNGTAWSKTPSIPATAGLYAAPEQATGDALFAGTLGSGLYMKATDASPWKQMTFTGTKDYSKINFWSNPSKIGNDYFIGTTGVTDKLGNPTQGRGLWETSVATPGTWTQTQIKGIPTNAIISDKVASINGKYFVSTFKQGVYTSSNGTAWTKVNIAGLNPTQAKIRRAPVFVDETYYLSTYGEGLFTSKDGITWKHIEFKGFSELATPVTKIGKTIYIGTYEGQGLWSKSVA